MRNDLVSYGYSCAPSEAFSYRMEKVTKSVLVWLGLAKRKFILVLVV